MSLQKVANHSLALNTSSFSFLHSPILVFRAHSFIHVVGMYLVVLHSVQLSSFCTKSRQYIVSVTRRIFFYWIYIIGVTVSLSLVLLDLYYWCYWIYIIGVNGSILLVLLDLYHWCYWFNIIGVPDSL